MMIMFFYMNIKCNNAIKIFLIYNLSLNTSFHIK